MRSTTLTAPLLEGSQLANDELINLQLQIEQRSIDHGIRDYLEQVRVAEGRGQTTELRPVARLMHLWLRVLTGRVREEQRAIRRGEPSEGRGIYGPIMVKVKAEKVAVIAMNVALRLCLDAPDGTVKVRKLAYEMGAAVYSEINLALFKSTPERRKLIKQLELEVKRIRPEHINRWAKKHLDDYEWSQRVILHLGAAMIWMLVDVCLIPGSTDDPREATVDDIAFRRYTREEPYYVGRQRRVRDVGYVELLPAARAIIQDGHEARKFLFPAWYPMVVAPAPWSDEDEGGYLRLRTPMMIYRNVEQQDMVQGSKLPIVHQALDALGRFPAKIDEQILREIEQVWAEGGGKLKVPLADDIPIPPKVDSEDREVIEANKLKRLKVHERNIERQAQAEFFTTMLDMSREFVRHDQIYFPHQMDWRGRFYPVVQHLNHQTGDLQRGLMRSAHAKPIGERGYQWILIHAANCYGHDKLSYNQRIQWATENERRMIDTAADPRGDTWWMDADGGKSPWRFLAACREIAEVHHGGGTNFESGLVIALDHSCSAVQHMAAMRLDPGLARLVNMTPSTWDDVPRDLYGAVLGDTLPEISQTADSRDLDRDMAVKLIDLFGNKMRGPGKQPIMTDGYGCTKYGKRKQLRKYLKDHVDDPKLRADLAKYLVKTVDPHIARHCESAKLIQNWVRKCAEITVSEPINQVLRWTTPIGLFVVHPYHNRPKNQKHVSTVLQDLEVFGDNRNDPPTKRKNCNAAFANINHGHDAAHLARTAIACSKRGIWIRATHDEDGSIPADVDTMITTNKQQFVDMYAEENHLMRYWKQWSERYPQAKFPLPPEPGDFDIRQVLESSYFLS